MNKQDRIYVAGHTGLVGSAIVRALERGGYGNIVTRSHGDLDLAIAADVDAFFRDEAPDVVIDAAARVGGIVANDSRPAEFIRDNLLIQTHLIHGAWRAGAQKFVFLGSSCIYPKLAEQPIRESALLTGELEPTNRAYAIAKIAGIEMCQAYRRQYGFNAIALMPTNLYGPNDNFDLESSHVLPAIIRKCHEARLSGAGEVILWGTGTPRREFLFVDDLADAVLFLAERYDEPDIINVGTGSDISIAAPRRKVLGLFSRDSGICGKLLQGSG